MAKRAVPEIGKAPAAPPPPPPAPPAPPAAPVTDDAGAGANNTGHSDVAAMEAAAGGAKAEDAAMDLAQKAFDVATAAQHAIEEIRAQPAGNAPDVSQFVTMEQVRQLIDGKVAQLRQEAAPDHSRMDNLPKYT